MKELPTKENTLYLPIKQIYFDEIIAGTKKEEYREVKDTTYKRYLLCDKGGNPDISADTPKDFHDDILAYNDGKYPFVPKTYKYLALAVGYAKERDTCTVEVNRISFEIAKDENDKELRFFWDEKTGVVTDAHNGNFAIWFIVYHLGDIIELHRK